MACVVHLADMTILDTGSPLGSQVSRIHMQILKLHISVLRRTTVLSRKISSFGQSVSSGPMLDLATRLPRLRVAVLHSPILSGIRVMHHVKATYLFDIYKNIDKIPLVNCPVLVIHIWPPKIVKDLGSRFHSKLKEAILQTGVEKNLFGNHPVLCFMFQKILILKATFVSLWATGW